MSTSPLSDSTNVDVVILGGGLAGLTLARQLRRVTPTASVLVVERQPRPLKEACHKVGESSVELASHYFGKVLGLDGYLRDRHFVKNGLRYYPGGGHTLPLEARTEIGPPQLPKVPSFQLDRGRLENDLRAMNESEGVTLLEGWTVNDIHLSNNGAPHVVSVRTLDGEQHRTINARWVVDAAGRASLLRKKMDLTIPSGHRANAAWFRIDRRLDVKDLVPATDQEWHGRDQPGIRWLSTVHFMGPGYWLWWIPLSSGQTSVGIVVHDELHPFPTISTEAKCRAWMDKHEPLVADFMRDMKFEDFLCLRDYSYGSKKVFSKDRWAMVGEAAVFADPFYSPGSDFIALSNSFVTELIRRDLNGESIDAPAEQFDGFFLKFFDATAEVYRHSAPVLGNPKVLPAKVYWDNFSYWSFVCQYFFKGIYTLPPAEQAPFIEVAEGFRTLTFFTQKMFREWALLNPCEPTRKFVELPTIPSVLANLHLDLEKEMTTAETLLYMQEKLILAQEVVQELYLRALFELGETKGKTLISKLSEFGVRISKERLPLEGLQGGARRRGLSAIARDIERTLGRVEPHPSVGSSEQMIGLLELMGESKVTTYVDLNP